MAADPTTWMRRGSLTEMGILGFKFGKRPKYAVIRMVNRSKEDISDFIQRAHVLIGQPAGTLDDLIASIMSNGPSPKFIFCGYVGKDGKLVDQENKRIPMELEPGDLVVKTAELQQFRKCEVLKPEQMS